MNAPAGTRLSASTLRLSLRVAARHAHLWPEALVLDLVARAYDAAGDAGRWPSFLTALQDAVGATGARLGYHDFRRRCGVFGFASRMEPAYMESYDRYYSRIMPGPERVEHLLTLTPVFCASSIVVPTEELLGTEYFADWLRPQRILHNISGCLLYDGHSMTSGFDLFRPMHGDDFGPRETGLVYLLLPHLRRALQLHERLTGLEQLQLAIQDAIESLALGVILFDADGQMVSANRAARRILASVDGLRSSGRLVRAQCRNEDVALRAVIHGAAQTGAGCGIASGGTLRISRPSGRQAYVALVSPLRTRDVDLVRAGTAAVLFLSDPERLPETPPAILQRLFGLTATEARVCSLLARGETVATVSQVLEISPHTARTHVKRILRKTGARGQSDLQRRLLAGPSSLLPPGTHSDGPPVND